jgi:hypothetical protein
MTAVRVTRTVGIELLAFGSDDHMLETGSEHGRTLARVTTFTSLFLHVRKPCFFLLVSKKFFLIVATEIISWAAEILLQGIE